MENKNICSIIVGIPGSGKSTFANKFIKDNPDVLYLSMDKIREEITGNVSDQSSNARVYAIFQSQLLGNMNKGKNVIVDNTSYNKKSRKSIIEVAKKCNAKIHVYEMTTPHNISKERNRNRERVVPDEVLERMINGYQSPELSEGIDKIILI